MEITSSCQCLSISLQSIFLILEQREELTNILKDVIFFRLSLFDVALTLHNDQKIIIRFYNIELYINMSANTIENRKDILIINADDFAYNSQFDKGIVELIINRKIKSISILINGPNIKQAANLLNQLQIQQKDIYLNCSFGLHFNLTEGKPFNTDLNGTKLVENGQFIGKALFYERIDELGQQMDKFIEVEAQLQINQFIKIFKRRPSHLDGHNHVHLVPRIAKILANLLPQFGIYRVRMLNQKISQAKIPLTPKFLSNNKSSFSFYSKKGILSPKSFIGIESFGKLDSKSIKQRFEKMQLNQQYRSIELMCHPGYFDQNGPSWAANPDRLEEKKQLQSASFQQLINQKGLSNYFDLLVEQNTYKASILIYSKLKRGTGNQTTTLRLKHMFEHIGYKVYLWHASDQFDIEVQSSDLTKFLVKFGITLIIGVNVSRSAIIISKATRKIGVPYLLVVAGTDANITFKDSSQVSQLSQALQNCECLVSLSEDMLQITQLTLKSIGLSKKIQIIVQSSWLSKQFTSQIQFKKPQKAYILLSTSFRKVKCVHHLFKQFNQLIEQHDLEVIIAGPIIEENYYLQCLPSIGKITYLGTLSKQVYAMYLKYAFVTINTSQSQGMSCSIIQAFEFGVPVIARNNSGNLQLIKHMHNGLIYQEPQEFISLVNLLKKDALLRQKLVSNASQLFKSKYCCQREIQAYKKLLDQIYVSRLYSYQKDKEWIRVLNQSFVHSTSEINNRLFFQMQPNVTNNSSILDICCGTGIFSLIFLHNSQAKQIDLYLADLNDKIIANAVYNVRQSSVWNRIRNIQYFTSDLFQNINVNVQYQHILINPPQTPFQSAKSRPDKNGGPFAISFYQPVLNYFAQKNPTTLYFYHSYMAWPSKFEELLKKYKLKVKWCSTVQAHQIHRNSYNEMQQNLQFYIMKHMREDRANIKYQNEVFYVPAVIYCIKTQ